MHLILPKCWSGGRDRCPLALDHRHRRCADARARAAAKDVGTGGGGSAGRTGWRGLVMFGMVAATGARILTVVNFKSNPNNLFIGAVAVGFGMIPLVAPAFFHNLRHELQPLLETGILLSAVVSVILKTFFNRLGCI
jgi:hypothetical protein